MEWTLPPQGHDFLVADNLVHRPVAALDQDVRPALEDALDGGVFVEPGDQVHAAQGGHHRQAVFQPVDGPVVALAQALHRGVGVEGHHHGGTEGPGLAQVGDVAPVQDVETAIGEHQGMGQGGHPGGQLLRGANLGFEAGQGVVVH